jgi:hypothetical protein
MLGVVMLIFGSGVFTIIHMGIVVEDIWLQIAGDAGFVG